MTQQTFRQVINKLDKIKKENFEILFSGKLFTNVYVISTCFAEIMASNESLSSGMSTIFWYFHIPGKRCSHAFRDHGFS